MRMRNAKKGIMSEINENSSTCMKKIKENISVHIFQKVALLIC